MSRDIYLGQNADLRTAETDVYKAENLLMVQIRTLYYVQDFGIDLIRFINPGVEIQVETFKAYTIDRLIANGIKVFSVQSTLDKFIRNLTYTIAEPTEADNVI